MAMALMREHELLTLRVAFRLAADTASLVLELLAAGREIPGARWEVDARMAGLPESAANVDRLELWLPAEVVQGVAGEVARRAAPDAPLWLLLQRPYGFAGGLPWEEALQPALGRPVLRLPDFLERQPENRSTLHVALIIDVPKCEKTFDVPAIAQELCLWLDASPREHTRLSIFASKTWHDEIRARYTSLGQHRHSAVLDIHPLPEYGGEDDDGLLPPSWFNWLERATLGSPVDVVHFVAPGYFARSQPTLALTSSPDLVRDEAGTQFVTPADAARALTRLGAWAVVCSAPPVSARTAPVACFADALAQARPGPVVFHDLNAPDRRETLASWIRFIFAVEPANPPMAAGFAYCQPALVTGTDQPVGGLSQFSELVAGSNDRWIASAMRVREQALVSQNRWAKSLSQDQSDVELSTDPMVEAALSDTLRGFDEIMERYGRLSQVDAQASGELLSEGAAGVRLSHQQPFEEGTRAAQLPNSKTFGEDGSY